MTNTLVRIILCTALSFGVALCQSRPTGTEYHTVYESADRTTLYGQSSLETSTMSIPPGTNIVHTITASFGLSANGGATTTFTQVQSGGPQDAYDPVATGSISEIGDAIYLQSLSDTALCNYFGYFFSDTTGFTFIDPPELTGLQTYTNTGQYLNFEPFVDTPQSPQQTMIIYGYYLTADGKSNPPTICINGVCSNGGEIDVTGFHLGGGMVGDGGDTEWSFADQCALLDRCDGDAGELYDDADDDRRDGVGEFYGGGCDPGDYGGESDELCGWCSGDGDDYGPAPGDELSACHFSLTTYGPELHNDQL